MLGWSGVPVSQGRARAVGAFTRAWGTEMLSHTLEDVVPADFGPAVMVCRAKKSYPPWVLSRIPVLGAQEWLVRRAGASSSTCVFQPIWKECMVRRLITVIRLPLMTVSPAVKLAGKL